jgi:hypothetical protein
MNPNSIRGWDAVFACALFVIAGCVAFTLLVPLPNHSSVSQKNKKAFSDRLMAKKIQEQTDADTQKVVDQTWDLPAEALEAKILNRMTELGKKHQLEVSHFTVARPTQVGGLIAAQSVVSFTGGFTDLIIALREIEKPDGKLVVTDVKIDTGTRQSSETGAEQVTAIISVASFLRDPVRYAMPKEKTEKLAAREQKSGGRG